MSRDAREPLAGTAPRADVWVVVEHSPGWGDAPLTRSGHGVRVLMARALRARTVPGGSPAGSPEPPPTPPATRGGTVARVWVAHLAPTPTLRVGHVGSPGSVASWALADIAGGSLRQWGRPDPEPLLLVCANGRRDRCCGHAGGRLADALGQGLHAERVLTCTHLGGHRFAPTALLLPAGALHGRLDVQAATGLLSEAARGQMPAETLRGHSTLEGPAQVAEAHARAVTGHRGLAALAVELDPTGDPDLLRAVVRGWDPHDAQRPLDVVLVRSTRSELLSCGRAPELTARWSVAP